MSNLTSRTAIPSLVDETTGPGERGTACPICREDIPHAEPSLTHQTCRNTFCRTCLLDWLPHSPRMTCPVCRGSLDSTVPPAALPSPSILLIPGDQLYNAIVERIMNRLNEIHTQYRDGEDEFALFPPPLFLRASNPPPQPSDAARANMEVLEQFSLQVIRARNMRRQAVEGARLTAYVIGDTATLVNVPGVFVERHLEHVEEMISTGELECYVEVFANADSVAATRRRILEVAAQLDVAVWTVYFCSGTGRDDALLVVPMRETGEWAI